MKKLDILITQYSETEQVIKPLLDSIQIQQNVNLDDIKVIICNDGSTTKLSRNFLGQYTFDIKYIHSTHKGVSGARNVCLDNSEAEYVMFCDADDMFFNTYGLSIIFDEIESGFDSLTSVFVEEGIHPETGKHLFINRETDTTFVHGKVHRRQFLLDNHIRWNEKLTIHEDSYFNILCKALAKEFKYIERSFYLWKWRDESVCRRDPKYILKTYNNLLDSNTALVHEFIARGAIDLAQYYVTYMIFDAYYTLNKDEWWDEENEEYKLNVETRFKSYYLQFKGMYQETPKDVVNDIISNTRTRMSTEGLVLEKITFNDWIATIEK